MQHPRWKITARQRESESHWLSLQRSVKDVPLWINRLVIGPMVGQTAALRLANRLASPLYYCVVTDTHTRSRNARTHTEPSCRLAHMSSCERHKQGRSRQHRQERRNCSSLFFCLFFLAFSVQGGKNILGVQIERRVLEKGVKLRWKQRNSEDEWNEIGGRVDRNESMAE